MANVKTRVLAAAQASTLKRPLEAFELEHVTGGTRVYKQQKPNTGNVASDDGGWVFD